MSDVADVLVIRQRAEDLLVEHVHSGDEQFLGAQYDAGLAWVHFPVGLGGRGAAPSLQAEVDAILSAGGRTLTWMRNPMGIGMVGPALVEWGSAQHLEHLRSIWTAEKIWCQLFSEPGAGSDVAALSTRAIREDGDWIINGQKVWTTRAHLASYGLLLARTDPTVPKHRGITAFILDMRLPGVDVRPLRQMTGHADFNEVYLTDVRIPDSARLGDVGSGWQVMLTTLMNERVSIGGERMARDAGPIAQALKAWIALGHSHPVRRDQLMRLRVEAEILWLTTQRAHQARTRGTPGAEGSILKLAQARLDQCVADFAIGLLGADGMLVPDYDGKLSRDDSLELLFLFSPAFTIAGGTTEVLKNIVAERVLGLPGERRVDKDLPWSDVNRG